jgi:hypothetical protein
VTKENAASRGTRFTRDPRSDAPLPLLILAWLVESRAEKLRDRILRPGPFSFEATAPAESRSSNADLAALRAAPSPFAFASLREPEATRALLRREDPAHCDAVLRAAERVLAGEITLLGARWSGRPPDWHLDPPSGARWDPAAPGRSVLGASPAPGADPKLPWELARFQFAVPLVQAFFLEGDPRYAQTYLDLVDDFLDHNPFPLGVNWAVAMDVALRAFSWTHALWHLRASPALDAARWCRWQASLRDHRRYVRWCLEFALLGEGNHYLANVIGLGAIATGVPGIASQRDAARQERRLAREVRAQTLDDGADWEGSTGYHRFVVEMFLGGALCGLAPGDAFEASVRSQLVYLDALCRADGTIPAIGDDDSGRVLPLDPSGPAARSVLDLGFALIPGAPRRDTREGPAPDLLWVGGELGYAKWRRTEPAARPAGWRSFPAVGVHVRRAGDWHVTAVSGPERSIGGGGHLHSDVLSVVAHAGGAERVLDPGTLTYAASRELRDRFRSARLHSTIAIPGAEARPLVREFRTGPGRIAEFENDGDALVLELELAPGCRVRRRIAVDGTRGLVVEDLVDAIPPRAIEVGFLLGAPAPEVLERGPGTLRLMQRDGRGELRFEFSATPPLTAQVLPAEAAAGYGARREAHRAFVEGLAGRGTRVVTRITFLDSALPEASR